MLSERRILSLAEKVPTPFYAYDVATLKRNFQNLQAALPESSRILYSMKANPHRSILALMKDLGAGIDVASNGELDLALAAGFTPDDVSFVGPGKTNTELERIVKSDLFCCVVESFEELLALERLGQEFGRRPRACVRVHPNKEISPAGLERASAPSQFGIDEDQLPELVSVMKSLTAVQLQGLHFFTRSMFLAADQILLNFRNAFQTARELEQSCGRALEFINLGGGFGIPYFAGQSPLDLAELGHGLRQISHGGTKLVFESGRFLAGPSGVFVTRVLYKKRSRGKTFLVCDGGMTQNLAAIGFGQVLRGNFPISVCRANAEDASREVVTIVGPSCYSVDRLGVDVELPRVESGDYVCITQAGAYGPTFSPTRFLTQAIPEEVIVPEEASIFLES